MPMRLPSGQVVWVRVEDQEPEPEPVAAPAPWAQPYPGQAGPAQQPAGGPSPYGAPAGHAPAGAGGGEYDYSSPYPLPQPGGADAEPADGSDAQRWLPPAEMGSPGGPPQGSGYPPQPQYGSAGGYGTAPGSSPGASPGSPGGSLLNRFRPKKAVQQTAEEAQHIQGFTEAVSGIAESVRDGLRRAKPDTVEIEFGLDIDVSAGAAISLIADAHAKAAVRITLGWDNRERAQGGPRVIEGSSEESGDARD